MNSKIDFKFQHIVLLSNRDILKFLDEIDLYTLVCACQNCDPYILDRISIQLSETGRNCFYDELYKNTTFQQNQIIGARGRIGKLLGYLYINREFKDWKTNKLA